MNLKDLNSINVVILKQKNGQIRTRIRLSSH